MNEVAAIKQKQYTANLLSHDPTNTSVPHTPTKNTTSFMLH